MASGDKRWAEAERVLADMAARHTTHEQEVVLMEALVAAYNAGREDIAGGTPSRAADAAAMYRHERAITGALAAGFHSGTAALILAAIDDAVARARR
jgi:hypothetical protein